MTKETKPCLFAGVGCKRPRRARGMCATHYEAHYMREVPIEKLMDPATHRLGNGDAIHVTARVSGETNAKLLQAVKNKRAKSRYAAITMILERWDGKL